MKSYIKNIGLLFIAIALFSCSSDDDKNNEPTEVVENFLAGYLEATGFNETVVEEINVGVHYECGLDFTPLVNGKITALKVMLPDANPTLRVTIWNRSTNTIMKTEIVNVATANTEFTFDIADIELVQYDEYAITMNSDDGYLRRKSGGSATNYPVTVGNIQINGYKERVGSDQTYPTGLFNNFYYGDLSFDFLQTD